MEIKTLSANTFAAPFNDTFETFFDTYKIEEDIECYQLVFCPYHHANGHDLGTNFEDLNKINFQSKTVILNIIDTIIDRKDNTDIEGLVEFCAKHPEQNFIIYNPHLNLQRDLNLRGIVIPNLYLDTIMPTNLTDKYKSCKKKEITNRWVTFNGDTKLHRIATICYLLSKDYYHNGDFTFDISCPPVVKFDGYKNISKITDYKLKGDIAKGYARLKSKDFNLLDIPPFDRTTPYYKIVDNYHEVLVSCYENVAVEIITGTMFFENTPVLSEKEWQSVYGKNFPIYINGVGVVRELKKLFDLDLFDDIIDHSYDEVEDHFERMATAINNNEKLLDGSTNIKELWSDNKKRFDNNCEKLDAMFFDKNFQRTFNHQKIKQSLRHFGVSFKE
jgi:hypothetical protein